MSGILRLQNSGGGSAGQSEVYTDCTSDAKFKVPDLGLGGTPTTPLEATLLTTNAHDVGSSGISWSGFPVTISGGDINLNSGTLFVDESTNQVGVGTTSPFSRFNVQGAQGNWRIDGDTVAGEQQVVTSNSDNSGFVNYRLRTNQFFVDTNGIERLVIDSTGRATFADNVTIGEWDYTAEDKNGVELGAYGYVSAIRDKDNSQGAVWEGYLGGVDKPTSKIGADGSATFTGSVVTGEYAADASYSRISLGQLELGRLDQPDGTNFIIGTRYTTGQPAEQNFNIGVDGSATFAGTIESQAVYTTGGDSNWANYTLFKGTQEDRVLNSSVTAFSVKGDGSAEFAGGNLVFKNTGRVTTNGYFAAYRPNDKSAVIVGGKGDIDSHEDNVSIYADGSASFDGTIVHNNWNDDSTGGLRITSGSSGGAIEIKGNGTDFGAISVRSGGNASTDEVVKIKGDGGATFAGDITAGNVSFNLEPDDDTNYVSTTDADGNTTSVYNGPTLDVKERLTKADTALQTLKTAAAAASDFAALKSAIATALADI